MGLHNGYQTPPPAPEYVYYQHLDEAVPPELWGGVDGYFTDQVGRKAGYARFWNETALGFDEPFRSYAGERVEVNPGFQDERAAP